MQFIHSPICFSLLGANILPRARFSTSLKIRSSLKGDVEFYTHTKQQVNYNQLEVLTTLHDDQHD
jgi:hypothetical protein